MFKRYKKLLAAVLSVTSVLSISFSVSAETETNTEKIFNNTQYQNTYSNYLKNTDKNISSAGIANTDIQNAGVTGNAVKTTYGEKTDTILLENSGSGFELPVNVEKEGFFEISLLYTGIVGNDKAIKLALEIDGQSPFFEAESFEIPRCYVNKTNDFEKDSLGNEMRPVQLQKMHWQSSVLFSEKIGTQSPYLFYLSEGTHTIAFKAENGGVCIADVSLKRSDEIISYEQYEDKNSEKDNASYEPIFLEGEKADRKSDISLYPLTDRTSCATTPFSPSNTVLNTVGGSNWSNPGQWMEWEFEIKEAGFYPISLRVRQNANQGMKCYRTISINGEVPFKELENYGFSYNRSWYIETLSDEAGSSPFRFYFEPGKYVLRMEATTGDMCEPLEDVNNLLTELNDLYHNIIMITGTSPDAYRDYNLEESVVGLVDTMTGIADGLDKAFDDIKSVTGGSGTQAVSLKTMSDQLRALAKRPKTISQRISNFYSNISAVSAWANSAFLQPLEIDRLQIGLGDKDGLTANSGFISSLANNIKSFIYTFITDYDSIGDASEKSDILVWTAAGRAQAESLKQLIDRDFTEQYGVNVSLKLVQAGLVEAVVAGTGPDIAISIGYNQPVDFASRGILVPLSDFSDYDELVATNFYKNATIPYEYKDKMYALPETQEFNMMFYRTDVLSQLGLNVPETWNELTDMMAILARNNMQVGVTSLMSTSAGVINTAFPKMLITMFMQNNVNLYADDLRSTNLGSPNAIKAFEKLTNLYSKYGLPIYFDANNRFRTGEMPIIISPMSTYNALAISAPEIAGRWGIAKIPGVEREDGSINCADEFTSTCSVMFKSTKNKEAGWQFLKWWVSEQTQYDYGMELEAVLGTSGRYLTANKLAFERLPWDSDTAGIIKQQWQEVSTVPQVPGYYFVSRYLTNAISDSIVNSENPRVVLNRYCDIIDAELKRKNEQLDALWAD